PPAVLDTEQPVLPREVDRDLLDELGRGRAPRQVVDQRYSRHLGDRAGPRLPVGRRRVVYGRVVRRAGHGHRMVSGSLAGRSPDMPAACTSRSDRNFRSANLSSRRITGRRNTNNVLTSSLFWRFPNRYFSTGMSARNGMALT